MFAENVLKECCCLHNFLQKLGWHWVSETDADSGVVGNVALADQGGAFGAGAAGTNIHNQLVEWVATQL
jgi:hypothetical protein